MRLSVLHNPSAGGAASLEEIRRELERAGYEIARELETDADISRIPNDEIDFLVVAGGDGTVRRAARALAGAAVPLAILPLGTANNIAKSLGIDGEIRQSVEGWRSARRVPFDLGIARGQWGESRFLESVGTGLVPAGIAAAQEHPGHNDTENARTKLERAVERYSEALSRLRVRRWTGLVDDDAIDGEYLLVEFLNVPSVGAKLPLAPDADPTDGWFDLVTAGEGERRRIEEFLETRRRGAEARLELPTRRARRAEILGWERMHVDDELRRIQEAGKVTLEIEPGAIEFLVGDGSDF